MKGFIEVIEIQGKRDDKNKFVEYEIPAQSINIKDIKRFFPSKKKRTVLYFNESNNEFSNYTIIVVAHSYEEIKQKIQEAQEQK
jgi:hypothetical protein